ncbi:CELL CYCLE CHECKPOINT PROTEIN RAD17 [Salix koriyanagi]|uniref:CELL CYCLE CHECKPOINT PROTEIN RAD17 n=1 Tax=Salix koriyanagi TaxID=2511006 RepID=A0A9Q0P5Y1_9ROSI|nr:CELL CYCLE CHECKPOINT PROTEIN RAD17 [Salix koriyanagi]
MRKIRDSSLMILSSDEEDDCDYKPNLHRSYTKKPKSRPFITRTNPRQPKKPRVSGSRSRSSRDSPSLFEQVGFPEEDFEELFSGSKVSAGSGTSNVNELWVDKYKPHSLEELAVHKKKVEEVKSWFEERLKTTKGNLINNVVVINGKAGVGKSTTVHVIASHFGARLCEWNTPTPTIWQEHVHNTNTGIQYTSKLDEFVNFIEKTRKYGLIPSSSSEDAKPSIILLIDDLPMTNGRVAFERLQSCLLHLVRSTQLPTAILVSDYDETDSTDHTAQRLEQLRLSLENAGACKVSFNPITINSIKKMLSRICRLEKCSVTDEQLDLIAKACGEMRPSLFFMPWESFCTTKEKLKLPMLLHPEMHSLCGRISPGYH